MIDTNFIDVTFKPDGALPKREGEDELFGDADLEIANDSALRLIPRNEVDSHLEDNMSLTEFIFYIMNQGREGSCVYNALASAIELIWFMMFGFNVKLSPISGYALNGRSPSSGSTVPGSLRWGQDVGLLPLDNQFNRGLLEAVGLNPNMVLPATGFYDAKRWLRSNDGDWQKVAKFFTIDEVWKLQSWEAFYTCLFYDFPVVGARDYHCINYVDVVKSDRVLYAQYRNSWGRGWGDAGMGYDSERKALRDRIAFGAYAVRSVNVPPWLVEALQYYRENKDLHDSNVVANAA